MQRVACCNSTAMLVEGKRPHFIQTAEIEHKYSGYIAKEADNVKRLQGLAKVKIKSTVNFDDMPSLSKEAREKLKHSNLQLLVRLNRLAVCQQATLQRYQFICLSDMEF